MELCLMIEGQEGVTWDQWLALARAADDHGLVGLFTSDHYASVEGRTERGSLDAWTVLSALAARTQRVRLGTLVSPVTFRHPSVLAKVAATVDHVSGGRVELGLGAGWYEPEHARYGFPFPEPRERLDLLAEQLRIVHEQWTEDAFSFHGAHYVLRDGGALFKPLQQPHPPLIVGGAGGPRSVRLAARWADEYDLVSRTVDECRSVWERLQAAAEDRGRDPRTLRLSFMSGCIIGRDEGEVLKRTSILLERRGEEPEAAPAFLDRVRDTWIVGTVEQVAERLHRLRDAGVRRVYLQHLLHDDLEAVRVIGEELAPTAAG